MMFIFLVRRLQLNSVACLQLLFICFYFYSIEIIGRSVYILVGYDALVDIGLFFVDMVDIVIDDLHVMGVARFECEQQSLACFVFLLLG